MTRSLWLVVVVAVLTACGGAEFASTVELGGAGGSATGGVATGGEAGESAGGNGGVSTGGNGVISAGAAGAGGVAAFDWQSVWIAIDGGIGATNPACDALCGEWRGADVGDGLCTCLDLQCDRCDPQNSAAPFTPCPQGMACGDTRCMPAGPVEENGACAGGYPERTCAPALGCSAGVCAPVHPASGGTCN